VDALDRQIAADLDVDPSPEFVARVRARVANESMSRARRVPLLLVTAAALAVAAVVAVSVGRVDDRPGDVMQVAAEFVAPVSVHVERPAPGARPAVRRARALRSPVTIELISIDEMPSEPIGTVVQALTVDEVPTLTGVHP